MRIKKHTATACICFGLFFLLTCFIPSSSHAEPVQPIPWDQLEQSEEIQDILQQSLSIQELDEEIARIAGREDAAVKRQAELTADRAVHEKLLTEQQEQAGRALRNYYMGERDLVLKAALSADSLSHMFRLLDYYAFLMEHDHDTITDYRNHVRVIQRLEVEQRTLAQDLNQVKAQLLEQRERILRLEAQLQTSVANSNDPAAMQQLIQEFTQYWQSVGLFEVKHYFRSIAKAMQTLPDFVSKNGNLVANGLEYTLTIKDSELNQFLREQDPLFNDFSFVFKDGIIAAVGERDSIHVLVEGTYSLEYEPEHALRFHIDKLQFNGLTLSEATRNQMTEQFDLSFYPKQLVSFIEATDVKLEPGLLTVRLQVKW